MKSKELERGKSLHKALAYKMNRIQSHNIALLKEIKAICYENDISFFLTEKTAYQAYKTHHFDGDSYTVDIGMLVDDALKFMNAVKCSDNRVIESFENNPEMPGSFLRYVDTSSTLIDVGYYHRYRFLGNAVNIHIFRNPNICSRTRRFERMLEILNNEIIYNPKTNSIKKKAKALLFSFIYSRRKMSKAVYHEMMASSGSDRLEYKPIFKKPRVFDRELITELSGIEFEGDKYPIVKDVEEFFYQRYGEKWEQNASSQEEKKSKFEIIHDSEIPFDEYVEYAKKRCGSIDRLIKVCNDYDFWWKKNVRPEKNTNSVEWRIVQRTNERFRLWSMYYPQKEKIMTLCREGKWTELADLLEEHDKVVRRFSKRRIGFCYDTDITNAYYELLKHVGRGDHVELYDALIPDEHRIDLTTVLLEYGINVTSEINVKGN